MLCRASTTPATFSSSTPKGADFPPMRIAPPCTSELGLMRTATRASFPRASQAATRRRASFRDSTWISPPPAVRNSRISASCFPGPAKTIRFGGTARGKGLVELTAGGDLEAAPEREKRLHDRGVRVRLDGVIDLDALRKSAAEIRPLRLQYRGVVDEERRTILLGNTRDRNSTDSELPPGYSEMLLDELLGEAQRESPSRRRSSG